MSLRSVGYAPYCGEQMKRPVTGVHCPESYLDVNEPIYVGPAALRHPSLSSECEIGKERRRFSRLAEMRTCGPTEFHLTPLGRLVGEPVGGRTVPRGGEANPEEACHPLESKFIGSFR